MAPLSRFKAGPGWALPEWGGCHAPDLSYPAMNPGVRLLPAFGILPDLVGVFQIKRLLSVIKDLKGYFVKSL